MPAGTLMVKTAQPLGNLAVYLLEPRSEDGLAAWKLFDDGLKAGSDFPVLRLPQPAPMTTTAAEALAEERKHDLPIASGRNGHAGFPGRQARSADLPVSARWLDGEHWLQVREGKLYKVEAATGRSRPFVDPVALAKGLKRLPTLDDETAQSIARRIVLRHGPHPQGLPVQARRRPLLRHVRRLDRRAADEPSGPRSSIPSSAPTAARWLSFATTTCMSSTSPRPSSER